MLNLEYLAYDLHRRVAASGNRFWMIGMAGVVIHAAFVYKLGDGLPAIPEISLSWKALLFRTDVGVYGADCGAGRCYHRENPGVNRIKFSADDIQRKFGPFGNRSPWVL